MFCKLSDGLLFNSDGVLTSFGVLTKVISIGRLMLSNKRLKMILGFAIPKCHFEFVVRKI